MREAIDESKLSRSENDGRRHPLVGAVLCDPKGNPLLRAHRGEEEGIHAEEMLLRKCRERGIDLTQTVLFVTLEPCTYRSPKHTPCALQIEQAKIPLVFIGILDPNPRISGNGETYLAYFTATDRFPHDLQAEIRQMSDEFVAEHRDAHVWAVSMYAAPRPSDKLAQTPKLSRVREPLLQQSLDLIAKSDGPVWIAAGDLSWMRELQLGVLTASLDRREVRILSAVRGGKVLSGESKKIALALGANVLEDDSTKHPLRMTLVSPATEKATAILIEASKATLYEMPDDRQILELCRDLYEDRWKQSRASIGTPPVVQEIALKDIIQARSECCSIEIALWRRRRWLSINSFGCQSP
jgi:pyrimidine deaminase RibD-like protein